MDRHGVQRSVRQEDDARDARAVVRFLVGALGARPSHRGDHLVHLEGGGELREVGVEGGGVGPASRGERRLKGGHRTPQSSDLARVVLNNPRQRQRLGQHKCAAKVARQEPRDRRPVRAEQRSRPAVPLLRRLLYRWRACGRERLGGSCRLRRQTALLLLSHAGRLRVLERQPLWPLWLRHRLGQASSAALLDALQRRWQEVPRSGARGQTAAHAAARSWADGHGHAN